VWMMLCSCCVCLIWGLGMMLLSIVSWFGFDDGVCSVGGVDVEVVYCIYEVVYFVWWWC